MSANAKLNRGSYRKIADLMSEAFDMCEKDTEWYGSDNEDVVKHIESAMKHLGQFRSEGSSDICKKASAVIDLVRGFDLSMQSDRPMRLASKFLFAIDEMMGGLADDEYKMETDPARRFVVETRTSQRSPWLSLRDASRQRPMLYTLATARETVAAFQKIGVDVRIVGMDS